MKEKLRLDTAVFELGFAESREKAKTLIMAGRDDDIVSIDLAEILNENIGDSRLVIFDNTKHNLLIGRNIDDILQLIRQFI